MRTFTLISPVGRGRLLASVAAAVGTVRLHPDVRLRWVCDFKGPTESPSDYTVVCRRTEAVIDALPAPGWFQFMSDDTLPDPDVLWKLMAVEHEGVGLVLGHQQLEDGRVRRGTKEILAVPGELDLGQGIIDIADYRRFATPVFSMGWERYWLKAFADEYDAVFIDDIISHHDALRVR